VRDRGNDRSLLYRLVHRGVDIAAPVSYKGGRNFRFLVGVRRKSELALNNLRFTGQDSGQAFAIL